MPSRMQGHPWHIEYLKTKDDRRHRARCVYFRPGGGCMLHEKCFGSSHCSKYRVVAVAETRVRNTNETYQPRNNKPLDERGKRKFKREKTPVTVQGIQLGDTVELLDTVDGFKMKVHIVEKEKACLEDNKISEDSPIGRAVLGKKKAICIMKYMKIRGLIEPTQIVHQ